MPRTDRPDGVLCLPLSGLRLSTFRTIDTAVCTINVLAKSTKYDLFRSVKLEVALKGFIIVSFLCNYYVLISYDNCNKVSVFISLFTIFVATSRNFLLLLKIFAV